MHYRRPPEDRALVQQFRILLALAAAISAWSAYRLFSDVLTIQQVISEFVGFLLAEPDLQNPAVRDGVRMANNAAHLLGALAVAGMVAIPLRYGWLATRIHRGHPWTLRRVQTIALLGLVVEIAKNAALLYVSWYNETLKFGFTGSIHFFMALTILWYARLRPVAEFFSTYNLKEGASSFASGQPEASG